MDNEIEGNTLTLNETNVILEGITVDGETLREHLEVINHQETIFCRRNARTIRSYFVSCYELRLASSTLMGACVM